MDIPPPGTLRQKAHWLAAGEGDLRDLREFDGDLHCRISCTNDQHTLVAKGFGEAIRCCVKKLPLEVLLARKN